MSEGMGCLEGLLERIRILETDHGVADRIRRRMAEHREAIGAQYDALLGTGPTRPPGTG